MTRHVCALLVSLLLAPCLRADDAAKPDIAKAMEAIAAKHKGNIAIGFKHLPSGETYFLKGDEVMGTASLCKLPVMIEVFYQIKEGKVKLSDPITVKQEDLVGGSGVLKYMFTPPLNITLGDAVNLMIGYSDNSATNLVLDKIGLPSTAARMKTLGFPHSRINSKVFKGNTTIDREESRKYGLGSTTCKEMVDILEGLTQGKFVDKKSCDDMIAILKKCEDNAKFPRYLPGVTIAHKTGSLDAARTDAGLIFSKEGPIAVCVLTDQNKDHRWTNDNAGNEVCAAVAKAAFDYCKAKYGTAAPAKKDNAKPTIHLEAADDAAPKNANDDLAKTLTAIAAKHQGKVAIAYKHLPSGETFFLNADEPMKTASLIKLPIMIETFYQVKEGKVKFSDPVTLKKEDKVTGSGILTAHFSDGATFPLRDAVDLMITFSDNTATNLVLDKIGIGATAERMKALGFPNTRCHHKSFKKDTTSIDPPRSEKYGLGSTTAREMMGIVEMVSQGKVVDKKSCEQMLGILRRCEDKDKFPRFLQGVQVAHKTGSLDEARTDAGLLVFKEGPVALCVLTDDNKDRSWTPENAGNAFCAQVAKAVVDHCRAKFKATSVAAGDNPPAAKAETSDKPAAVPSKDKGLAFDDKGNLQVGNSDLGETLKAIAAKHKGKVTMAFKHLPSGETFFLNADEVMRTASLCKLPVMIETFYQLKEGKEKLTDPITITEEDLKRGAGSGILAKRPAGTMLTLGDAVDMMIRHSDNLGHPNLVLGKIGIGSTWARMKTLGFPETAIHSLVNDRSTTVRDGSGA